MSKSEEKGKKEKEKVSLSDEQRQSVEEIIQDEEKRKVLEQFIDSLEKYDVDLLKKGILFLDAVGKYKLRKATERLGIAHLIYRKHLAKDSYLYVGFIESEVTEKIFKFIDTEINKDIEKQENASRKLFDEAIHQVYQYMTPHVFLPFFKSKQYKDAVVLSAIVKKLKQTRIF